LHGSTGYCMSQWPMQCDWAIFDPLGYIKAYAVLCACISDLSWTIELCVLC